MYDNMVAARVGYHIGAGDLNYATVGLGCNFKGFSLNAAYLLGSILDGTLMLGLETKF
jgi:hypothetical protein